MYLNMLSVGGLTLLSRLTGFLRDVMQAALLGGGGLNDAYVQAFKLPNQFRQIFGEGAFNTAYVPSYARVLQSEGEAEAGRFASQVFTMLAISQVALLTLAYLDTPLLLRVTSPGWVTQPEKFDAAVGMTRIMFPYLAFITLVTLHSGTLNAHGAFATAALGKRKLSARKAMIERLSSTGAKAAAAKAPCALSVPECSVTRVMKAR